MTYLNEITHPDKLIESKVNFFADYYNFVASQIEFSDYLDVENYLSLVEKIIYQIETNIENCSKYIDSYLTHPLLQKDNRYFKEYKNFTIISDYFEEFKKLVKPNAKVNFIKSSDFKLSLIKFKNELKRNMFKKSLNEIISFLKCIHTVDEHRDDIIHHSNILVSEFLLNNTAKDDIIDTFSKIITKDIDIFPFPSSFLKENKNNLVEAKKRYLNERTFDQQFEGIFNFLKNKPKSEYFIYRVYNINSYKNFHYKYNKVSFYHPEHTKFKHLKPLIEKEPVAKDFFNKDNMILATIKVKSFSKRIAEKEAVSTIKKELKFIDNKFEASTLLEKHSYLSTSNFKNLGWRWLSKEKSYKITNYSKRLLDNNPYKKLVGINSESKNHFLKYEPLYIKAEESKMPEEYWQYFETLFQHSTSRIIEIISTLLYTTTKDNEEKLIKHYIINSIGNTNRHELVVAYKKLRNNIRSNNFNINELKADIEHPFLEYLFDKRQNSTPNKNDLKSYYSRIIWECYSQRNSIMHSYDFNEKTLISLDINLSNLVIRLRDRIIDGIIKNNDLGFSELIDKLTK